MCTEKCSHGYPKTKPETEHYVVPPGFVNEGQHRIHTSIRWMWFCMALALVQLPGMADPNIRPFAVGILILNIGMAFLYSLRIDEINKPE
jgi:hypothetical protein